MPVLKGAESYSGRGGGQIARMGHPGHQRRIASSVGELRAAGANHAREAVWHVQFFLSFGNINIIPKLFITPESI